MKNGKCPMCNSTEVYTNTESEFVADGDSVELYDIDNDLRIYLTPYVCVKCGFVAMFTDDADEIADLPDEIGWKRVTY
jgi:hypothetical protein